MDSTNFHNNIKVEKANAIRRYRRLRNITAAMFRFIELCIFLIVFSRFSTQFPFVFKVPGEYFRGLSVTLISPWFVFILGNVILVVLLTQSGQFADKDGHKSSYHKIDFYDEYMKNCRNNQQIQQISSSHEGRKVTSDANKSRERKIHRTHSEKLERMHQEEPNRHELRRSMTETCRKSVNHCHNPSYRTRKLVFESKKQMNASYAEDELSNEEFRRTIEAFIERRQRILREEEVSPTVFPIKNY